MEKTVFVFLFLETRNFVSGKKSETEPRLSFLRFSDLNSIFENFRANIWTGSRVENSDWLELRRIPLLLYSLALQTRLVQIHFLESGIWAVLVGKTELVSEKQASWFS